MNEPRAGEPFEPDFPIHQLRWWAGGSGAGFPLRVQRQCFSILNQPGDCHERNRTILRHRGLVPNAAGREPCLDSLTTNRPRRHRTNAVRRAAHRLRRLRCLLAFAAVDRKFYSQTSVAAVCQHPHRRQRYRCADDFVGTRCGKVHQAVPRRAERQAAVLRHRFNCRD